MTTPTANYGWTKPDIGASNDAWGGMINADLDGIDSTVKAVSNVANAALPSSTASSTYVAKAGDTMTGTLNVTLANGTGLDTIKCAATTGPCNHHLDAAAGQNRQFVSSTAGSARWNVVMGNATAEGGSNAGSDFGIVAYSDAGATLATPFYIWRATATVAFNAVGATAYSGAAGVNDINVILNKAGSGHGSILRGANNGVFRWALSLGDNTAESSNAGSNFVLSAYNDAGAAASVPTPLTIARGTGVATFAVAIVNGSSDRRLKENVEPLTDSLAKVRALQGVSFNFIANPDKPEIGLIAQDVEEVVPEVIQPYDFGGEETLLSVDYPKLVAHLIEAIKTLTVRVETLEASR